MDDLEQCYRTLDLEPGASLDEVKRAWRDLTKVWHPDRFQSDPRMEAKAEEKLKTINEAYARLRQALGEKGSSPYSDTPSPTPRQDAQDAETEREAPRESGATPTAPHGRASAPSRYVGIAVALLLLDAALFTLLALLGGTPAAAEQLLSLTFKVGAAAVGLTLLVRSWRPRVLLIVAASLGCLLAFLLWVAILPGGGHLPTSVGVQQPLPREVQTDTVPTGIPELVPTPRLTPTLQPAPTRLVQTQPRKSGLGTSQHDQRSPGQVEGGEEAVEDPALARAQTEARIASLEQECLAFDGSRNDSACVGAGLWYRDGRGVPQDLDKAYRLLTRACQHRDWGCDAARAVGRRLAQQAASRAPTYQRQCLEENVPAACLALGRLYESGWGVEANAMTARALFGRACNAGLAEACTAKRD